MRHIARNQITNISASSQDGNFPASNLLDGKPGRKWKAGGLTRNATLTMEIAGGVSDVALFGTNAREATATAEDPCAVTFGDNPSGPNLITNGTMDSSSGWIAGIGWSISGGVANGSPGTASWLRQIDIDEITTGLKCQIKADIARTVGSITGYLYGDDGSSATFVNALATSATINAVATPSGSGGALSNAIVFSKNSSFGGSVDNVEVYAMTADELKGGDILKNTDITTTATTTVDENGNALRVNFNPTVTVPCEVTINLTSPGNETLYAGVAFGGTAETYGGANFRYGAGVALNDYSITAQNSNGSRYYKKRTIGRQYQLTALMLRAEADKLEATIRRDGAIASAWALFDNSSETIYGWPQMQRSMDHRLHDNIQLTITEEI